MLIKGFIHRVILCKLLQHPLFLAVHHLCGHSLYIGLPRLCLYAEWIIASFWHTFPVVAFQRPLGKSYLCGNSVFLLRSKSRVHHVARKPLVVPGNFLDRRFCLSPRGWSSYLIVMTTCYPGELFADPVQSFFGGFFYKLPNL